MQAGIYMKLYINAVINNVVYLGQLIQRIVFLCVFIYGRLRKL